MKTSTVLVLFVVGIVGIQAAFIDDLYREINGYRATRRLPALRRDSNLEYHLFRIGDLPVSVGHGHSQYANLEDEARKKGNGCFSVKENIAWNDKLNARDIVAQWKKSTSGHNEALLTTRVIILRIILFLIWFWLWFCWSPNSHFGHFQDYTNTKWKQITNFQFWPIQANSCWFSVLFFQEKYIGCDYTSGGSYKYAVVCFFADYCG